MSTPEEQQQQWLADYRASVDEIIRQGHEDLGDETFDSISQDVATAVGKDAIEPLMEAIRHCDAPVRVIQHLAENPERAKAIAAMPAGRRNAELGRIEAQIMPSASVGGADPAWKARARGGEKRTYSDAMSDAEFERFFKKKHPGGFNPYAR